MQGGYNILKSINMIHHINGVKDKNHMIISKDTEKAFNNTQYPFMIKNSQITIIRRKLSQHNKHYENSIANTIYNGKKN